MRCHIQQNMLWNIIAKKVDLHLKCMLEFQIERKLNLYKCRNYSRM